MRGGKRRLRPSAGPDARKRRDRRAGAAPTTDCAPPFPGKVVGTMSVCVRVAAVSEGMAILICDETVFGAHYGYRSRGRRRILGTIGFASD